MNEEIPRELQDFDFAEIGNNQQNIWRLRDELNATRRWLRQNTVSPEEEVATQVTSENISLETKYGDCAHLNSYQMRPGLMKCKDCKKVYKV